MLLKFLKKENLHWHIVLTKADLLTVDELAKSVQAVRQDTIKIFDRKPQAEAVAEVEMEIEKEPEVIEKKETAQEILSFISPVSAKTGAGIAQFWRKLNGWVEHDTNVNSVSGTAVREHKKANLMRRNRAISLNIPKTGRKGGGKRR